MPFSGKQTATEKRKILSEKYDITLTEKEEERMENMGGLGEGIERRALARGEEKGIEKGKNLQKIETVNNMNGLGISNDIIAVSLKMSVDEVKRILDEKKTDVIR